MRHSEAGGTNIVDRRVIAQHFHALATITREQIFGAAEPACRPLNLYHDVITMFAGYVGPNFVSGRGLLLLAINPGGGGDAYTCRIPEDEVFYPLLAQLKTAKPLEVVKCFERTNEAFARIVQGWNLWRILEPTLRAAGTRIEDVAYMNVVPYRTRGDKMPPIAARRSAWNLIIDPTIRILAPQAMITLGKKAGSVVQALYSGNLATYCVPRTIGDTYISDEALGVHSQLRAKFHDA